MTSNDEKLLQGSIDRLVGRLTMAVVVCVLTFGTAILSSVWWGATVQTNLAANGRLAATNTATIDDMRRQQADLAIATAVLTARVEALNETLARFESVITEHPAAAPR